MDYSARSNMSKLAQGQTQAPIPQSPSPPSPTERSGMSLPITTTFRQRLRGCDPSVYPSMTEPDPRPDKSTAGVEVRGHLYLHFLLFVF